MNKIIRGAAHLVPLLALALVACQSDLDDDRGPEAKRESALPVVQVHVDEDGPITVREAIAVSDYVVIARIVEQRDGARFFGQNEEDPGVDRVYESVDWTLEVTRWLKGDPGHGKRLTMRATPYLVDDQTSPKRIATVEWGGVHLPLDQGASRYVFFLKQHPDPWGLTTISAGAGIIQLDEQNRLGGELSMLFERHRGADLGDVLPPGV